MSDDTDNKSQVNVENNGNVIGTGDETNVNPIGIATTNVLNNNKSTNEEKIDMNSTQPTKEWVKFDDDDANKNVIQTHPLKTDDTPAVLTTESVHVQINSRSTSASPKTIIPPNNSSGSSLNTSNNNTTNHAPTNKIRPVNVTQPNLNLNKTSQPAVIELPSNNVIMEGTGSTLRTIELSSGRVREGFANGDIIVTLLPVNTRLPWITPAKFRPELVPEELMAQGLTLTVEEYVHAMETLVNDYRFTLYNICYKRVLVCWILFAFCVLLGILFSGLTGITLFSLGVAWLFLNAAAVFMCMWVKLRLARGLERCMARVNKQLLRHKILLALDDRGNISCHKVNLCFLYFEPSQCVNYINEFIERNEQQGTVIQPGWEEKLDVSAGDIVIQGSNITRVSRKQERGLLLFLRYSHRWGNEAMRGFIDVTTLDPARHCSKYQCICQYVIKHLSTKPRGKLKLFNFFYWVKVSDRYCGF
uniref:CSON008656 protein n=2 Tax=Culicoides sonorensis TaxID=179676 RepID=A0A336MYV8_CULSO